MRTFLPYGALMLPRSVLAKAAFTVAFALPLVPLTVRTTFAPFAPAAPFAPPLPLAPLAPSRPFAPGMGSGATGAIGFGTLSIVTGWAAGLVTTLPAALVTRVVSV